MFRDRLINLIADVLYAAACRLCGRLQRTAETGVWEGESLPAPEKAPAPAIEPPAHEANGVPPPRKPARARA